MLFLLVKKLDRLKTKDVSIYAANIGIGVFTALDLRLDPVFKLFGVGDSFVVRYLCI